MINWKKWLKRKPKQELLEEVITPIDEEIIVPIRFIIDVSEDKVEFTLEQNGISPICSYVFAKLLVDLERGKPILMQNLMDIMPEDDPRSTLILQHYISMRDDTNRPCVPPAEIFNVNRAQDLRE